MNIQANKYIKTAFSMEDAETINPIIDKAVEGNDKVILNFDGITFFTTLFFSSTLARFIEKIGFDAYNNKFEIIGLTQMGPIAYQHALDFALERAKMSEEEKKANLFAVDDLLDEV